VDPGQIEQVIVNLVINARDAMPGGGRLTIETGNVELDDAYARTHPPTAPGCYVMLAVSDSGIGMTGEVKDRIFEPFFTTKELGKGTGLGLATVYGIIKQSGGYIWVYTEVGRGTTFKIYLPMVSGIAEEFDLKPMDEVDLSGTETVLVVEDEDSVRRLTSLILRMYGYKVIEAHDGMDGLTIASDLDKPVDIVVTDIVMPRMSGVEMVQELYKRWGAFKLLYISGYTANAIMHDGAIDPGTPYLQKPFRVIDFARKVRDLLDA